MAASTGEAMTTKLEIIIGSILISAFMTNAVAQDDSEDIPFQPIPERTINTNGATFLPDRSMYPTPPGWVYIPPESPGTTTNFQGLTDNSSVMFPPDTHGAVGTNHIVTMVNNQVRIMTRTGAIITNLSPSQFWSSSNFALTAFPLRPRILYDPFNDHWIASAMVEHDSPNSGILLAVSRTSNPTNIGDSGWNMHRVKSDSESQRWAAFPKLGFNKDWIVVSANMWFNSMQGGTYDRNNFYVFDKTNLYSGSFTYPTILADTEYLTSGNEFPAFTCDNSVSALYIVQNANGNLGGGGYGYMRILSITGAVATPTLNYTGTNALFIRIPQPWDDVQPNNGADFAPQLGITNKVQNNDSSIGNLVYRNGYLWFAHTVFLPSGGSPTRSAIQWWQVHPASGLAQYGRIEDSTNYYAFPSIAVNRWNDVLIGFSRYSSNQYISANYAFRGFNDPINTMQVNRAFKSGEDSYWKSDNANHNRWGDYSATCVDPLNDKDFWTVQEYSAQHVGSLTNKSGRWGVWWGNVSLAIPTNDNFSFSILISGLQGSTNGNNLRATKETGEPNHADYAGGASIWYEWTAPGNGSVTIDTIGSTFNALLAVYTGISVSNLTTVASDYGSAKRPYCYSRVTFTATSNTTYLIAVDGYNNAMGNLMLNWLQPTAPAFIQHPQSQTIYAGNDVTFMSTAIGSPNPSYQWQFNSSNIAGATSSNLNILAIQTNNTGNYAVVASNSSGSVTSTVALLTVLTSQATLDACAASNNLFVFRIATISNLNYIVEANTNLGSTNWIAVATNTAVFYFTDTAFTNNPQRFYRAVYKP